MNLFRRDIAFAAVMLAGTLPLLAQHAMQGPAAPTGVDLLLIEHTDDGVVERSGHVHAWRYVADSSTHAVLCVDHTPDGDLVMRDGFDSEVPSCQ